MDKNIEIAKGTNGGKWLESPECADFQTLSTFLTKQAYDVTPQRIVSVTVNNSDCRHVTDTHCVTVTCILGSGRKKKLKIILKTPKNWKLTTNTERFTAFFQTEMRVYTMVLPQMEVLMEEFEDKRETLWPKLYGLNNSMIDVEDLTESRYFVHNRKNPLDLQHSILVLRSLARYHAMSMELLSRGWIGDGERGTYKKSDAALGCLLGGLITKLCDAMSNDWGEEWIPISNKLRTHRDTMMDDFYELVCTRDQKFTVFNHGDLWNSNIMFQYSEVDRIPVSVKFIDYQACHLNSFVWDLIHFTYSTVDPFVRRQHLNTLYEHYHDSLATNLELFKFTGYVPTLEDVKSESERVEFCHMTHVIMSSWFNADCEKPCDLAKIFSSSPDKAIDDAVYSSGKAKRLVGDDLKYFYASGVM